MRTAGGTADGLRLEAHELNVLADPIWSEYERSGQADVFAAAYASFFEAAFGPSLFSAVDPSRSAQEQQSLTKVFGDRLRGKIMLDPSQAVCHWKVFTML